MAIVKDGTTLGSTATVYLNGTSIGYGSRVYLNGTEVFRRCYTAGTNTTLYSHSSGNSSVGEGFFRELEAYTVPNCGTFNVSGSFVVGSSYPSKIIDVDLYVNDTKVADIYYVGGGSFRTANETFNLNLSSVIESGDKIRLMGYVWGNYGTDRFESSSMTVKVA